MSHVERFIRAEIIVSEKNTGVAGNMNRAERACQGSWIKTIGGDDKLLPECISDYIQFTEGKPNAKYIFSRVVPFGGNKKIVELYEKGKIFDYDFFSKTTEQQLEAFVLTDVHIPAITLFYNRLFAAERGIKFDERLPMIEDEPLWINVLKAGVHLYFLDKPTVMYRVGDSNALSSPSHVMSPKQFESICRFFFYYKFPVRYERDPDDAINRMLDFILFNYNSAYSSEKGKDFKYSLSYRIFWALTWPFRKVKAILKV